MVGWLLPSGASRSQEQISDLGGDQGEQPQADRVGQRAEHPGQFDRFALVERRIDHRGAAQAAVRHGCASCWLWSWSSSYLKVLTNIDT